jgi:hypothetical protein
MAQVCTNAVTCKANLHMFGLAMTGGTVHPPNANHLWAPDQPGRRNMGLAGHLSGLACRLEHAAYHSRYHYYRRTASGASICAQFTEREWWAVKDFPPIGQLISHMFQSPNIVRAVLQSLEDPKVCLTKPLQGFHGDLRNWC